MSSGDAEMRKARPPALLRSGESAAGVPEKSATASDSPVSRPRARDLLLFLSAYVLAAGYAKWLAIIPGTGISIWPPAGVYLAAMLITPRAHWPWWIAAALLAELAGNFLLFHNPLGIALVLNAGNALCAYAGARLVLRFAGGTFRLQSLRDVTVLALAALSAPVLSASVGAATLAVWEGQPLFNAWKLWWVGDATGILVAAPLILVVHQRRRIAVPWSARRGLEAALLVLTLLGIAAVSLGGQLPFAYLVMVPLVWAAVRFEFQGAVTTTLLLAVMTAFFTAAGLSPFSGDAFTQQHRSVMLQLFLTISALAGLVVAAIATEHRLAMRTLSTANEDLEARVAHRTRALEHSLAAQARSEGELRDSHRFVTEVTALVPGVIYVFDVEERRNIYVNRQTGAVLGYSEEEVRDLGADFIPRVIHPQDAPRLERHLAALQECGSVCEIEYRFAHRDGSWRWFLSRDVVYQRTADGRVKLVLGIATDITDRKTVEERLRASERRFRTLADSVPIVLWVTNADGGIESVNREYERFFGVTEAQVKQGGWQPLVHPEMASAYVEAFAAALSRRESFEATARVRRYDGAWRTIVSRGVPRVGSDGSFLGMVGSSTDITEVREAEERARASEADYRAVFEVSTLGMAHADIATRRLLRVNPALCRITGFSEEELLAMTVGALNHPDDRERDEALFRGVLAGEVPEYAIEKRYLRRDGSTVWVQATGNVTRDPQGVPLRAFAIIQDITSRRRAEEALAEEARRKDEFLAMLAHELRNPLAPIRTASELLRIVHADDPMLEMARSLIERQVAHMVRLVDDLMDVSRISRGKIKLKRGPVDLSAVVRHAIEAQLPSIESRGQTLHQVLPGEPLAVWGDFTRLAQAIGNLVSNAVKYTDDRGRIDVVVERVGETQDAHALVRVRDDGRGIPPEAMPHLFEMFYQADSTLDRREGGLGVGLALVKRLVELHGGTVEARSEGRGRGSEFVIRLPLLPAELASGARPAAVPPSLAQPSLARRRILVVDDNVDAADSLALLLRADGHEVEVAYDGKQAVDIAIRDQPDAILLDLGLPGLSGFEACRAMREAGLASAVIVAVTGYAQARDQRSTTEAGFDEHLVKPVDFAALRTALARRPASATTDAEVVGPSPGTTVGA